MTRTPVALVAALAMLVAATPATATDTTADLPELQPLWVDADLDDGRPSGGPWSLWGWGTTPVGHAGGSLRTFLNEGEHGAAGGQVHLTRPAAAGRPLISDAYLRYWLWLDPGFELAPGNAAKLPGLAALNGTYRCLGGKQSLASAPCWTARTIMAERSRETGPLPAGQVRLGSYAYHLDVPGGFLPYGEPVLWDADGGTVPTGQWVCVEQRVRMNTPGLRDGILQAWVDGERVLDRRDLRWRRAGEATLGVQTIWMDLYHGGRATSPRDNEVRVDSVAAGPQRVGCADAAQHDGTFHDDDRSPHQQDVEVLAALGVTRGCDPARPTRFCPAAPVTRGELAMMFESAFVLPRGTAAFTDVTAPRGITAVGSLVAADVTRGCDTTRFCPTDPVTRAELATFAQRLLRLPAEGPLPTDLGAGSPLADGVRAARAAGLLADCGPDRFCPDASATREVVADVVVEARRRFGLPTPGLG